MRKVIEGRGRSAKPLAEPEQAWRETPVSYEPYRASPALTNLTNLVPRANDKTIIDSGERIRDLQQFRQRISAAAATTVTPDMFQHTRHQGRGRLEPGVGRGWMSALQRNQQHLGRLPFRTGFAHSNVNGIPLFSLLPCRL